MMAVAEILEEDRIFGRAEPKPKGIGHPFCYIHATLCVSVHS